MSTLLIALSDPDSLDPIVRAELEQLIAALQVWANVSGDHRVAKNLSVGGSATINQPAFRAILDTASVMVTGAETPILWRTPNNTAFDPSEFHTGEGISFIATTGTVYVRDPGIYLLHARVRWDSNAAGTFRAIQFRVGGDDTSYDIHTQAAAASLSQRISCILKLTPEFLSNQGFNLNTGVPMLVEGVQDSGANRAFTGGSFSVVKIA